MTNDLLRDDLQALDAITPVTVLGLENQHWGVTLDIEAPAGFVLEAADSPTEAAQGRLQILLRLNEQFPHTRPDMFWVRPFLKLPGGRWPGAAEHFEVIHGKKWQRFSWHLKEWSPGRHHLATTFWPFVIERLKQVS